MNDRTKVQIWSPLGWRTVYILPMLLMGNITLLRGFGIKFRVVS